MYVAVIIKSLMDNWTCSLEKGCEGFMDEDSQISGRVHTADSITLRNVQ